MNATERLLVNQGAEARLWESVFLQRPVIVKERFKKQYRTQELDAKLTISRLKQEARGLIRSRKLGVLTPVLYYVDYNSNSLFLEKIEGRSVKEMLSDGAVGLEQREDLFQRIGTAVATLHDGDLNHGDLTTSNMLVRPDGALVFIDFGLSYKSTEAEDKAVDLYVLERAITSAHAELSEAFQKILDAYQKKTRNWSRVFPKYKAVRMRGRKRLMIG